MTMIDNRPASETRRLVLASIFALGAAAVMTQLALLREMLAAFEGNEMVFGILLGNWLLLTGAGSWLGRRAQRLEKPLRTLTVFQLLVAVLPLAQVVAVRTLRNAVFIRGAMIGMSETTLAGAVVLAPFCLVSGYLLTLACSILGHSASKSKDPTDDHGDAGEIGRVYVADSLGSIVGGVLFSFALVRVLDHYGALLIPAAINLTLAAVMAWRWAFRPLAFAAAALLAALAFTTNMDALTTQWQYGRQKVVFRGNSPYGKLVVTESARQLNFIENGLPLFSTHNTEQIEETVHYAMAQRPDARRVLLIGGGMTGTAREILKYGVQEITYVELDPLILSAAQRFVPDTLADPRIKIVNTDGRLFVKQTANRYDVVIVDMPAPDSTQINRFYTAEFYAEIKRILTPGGVLSFALGRYENYVSPELARLLSSARQTLRESFRHTLLLPGGRVFVLASDGELTDAVAARIAARGIPTRLMTRHYLDAMLTPERLAAVRGAAEQPATLNQDFNPSLYYYHLRYWLSQNPKGTGLLTALLLTATIVCPLLLRGRALVVFAGGFAASALEVVLLLGVQILCGSVYHQVGIVVTAFMAGLAVGAWVANRLSPSPARRTLTTLAMGIGLFAAMLPLALTQLAALPFAAARALVPALTFGLAVLVGMEFPVASRAERAEVTVTAAQLYAADFAGACLGALLTSSILIPLLGVAPTCWITAGLNLVSAALLWRRKRQR